jgi:large subunit ribosomal protein L29
MKIAEIRGIEPEMLKKKVAELKAELGKEKALVAGGTRPENPGKINSLKKTIARTLTVIKEKESKKNVKTKEKR